MRKCNCGETFKIENVSLEEAPLTPCEYKHADRCRLVCSCGKRSIVYIGGSNRTAKWALENGLRDIDGNCLVEWENSKEGLQTLAKNDIN